MHDEFGSNDAEMSMLKEVASWSYSNKSDFILSRCITPNLYSVKYYNESALRVVTSLNGDEARILERHVTFPASRADLLDLPRRIHIAKLLALIED